MTRRKTVCLKWTLVSLLVVLCHSVQCRPQEVSSSSPVSIPSTNSVQSTETPTRITNQPSSEVKKPEVTTNTTSRDVKAKGTGIGDSIKMVASQLLENPSNSSVQPPPIVPDTRIPPKLKNQLVQKHKIKTRNENGEEPLENAHAGVAVPVTMEELESENKVNEVSNESSTSYEGISTWILLSNPVGKDNVTSTTEPTKVEENVKKPKPAANKNKTKRPPVNKPVAKRPIIGSTNKSDLVAGGSAINENVYNKIKDTVLSNVQKNKSTSTQRTTPPSTTTTVTTTTTTTTEQPSTTKKEATSATPVVAITSKPTKKKNKIKQKVSSTTEAPVSNESSALLPMEPKEQEIELEISTPATTTKKPKRSSSKKKKTKKRKTSKPKPDSDTSVSKIKTSNKTKSSKPSKKPTTDVSGVTTQIYNYFSREVMPSVGVGVIGLASLVGLASYFLYPFSTPVRRTFEVDKKDDLYKHNAEEYANDGNGQAEEEMLGTVLAGMPAHSKHKLNPYAGQTTHVNRNPYPVKKEQDIRYRHVSTSKYEPNYNVRYPQQKTGIAHGAVYSEPVNYNPHQPQYETRHVYTTESKYLYDKAPTSYTPSYPAVEPIYAAPQTGPSGISSYGSDASNAVVYGVKPSADSDFKPVYPFEGQYYGEQQTTSNPITYPPTSMYLGSNNDSEQPEEQKYDESNDEGDNTETDNKFVVGNVPKELSDSVTPAVVPEHGPRNLSRKKRSLVYKKRSITGSIEEILKAAKENNKDTLLNNEIDQALGLKAENLVVTTEPTAVVIENKIAEVKEVFPVYAKSVDATDEAKTTTNVPETTERNEFIESVSTLPINGNKPETTTETEMSNELEDTTKAFRVYEVFSAKNSREATEEPKGTEETKTETTTSRNMMTETTTELKSETTSTMPSVVTVSESKAPPASTTSRPKPTIYPEVITYPPLNQEGSIFTFLKRLIEFKYRLGLSLLQNTSESINRYLRSFENTTQKVANASKP